MTVVFTCAILVLMTSARSERIIGAVLDDGGFLLEAVFNVAIGKCSENQEDPFQSYIIKTSPGDVLEAENAVCELLQKNIFGIIGPTNKGSIIHIQSIADSLEIPQITFETIEVHNRNWSAIDIYPHYLAYSKVFVDIILAKGWIEFTLIYEGAEYLSYFDNILTMQDVGFGDQIVMNVVQLPDGDDFRSQLKAIKNSESVNYVVDCRIDKLPQFLEQAQQVGIMSDPHSYVIMTPDLHTIDLKPYQHGGSNITGVRFIDPEMEDIKTFVKAVNEKVTELSEGRIQSAIEADTLQLKTALLYDSVMLYTTAIATLGLTEANSVTCDQDSSWNFGSSIVNHIRTLEVNGLTGIISFDDEGFRSEFELDVIELVTHGIVKVGKWNAEDGYEQTREVIPSAENAGSENMKGKHFIVLTALSHPYGMLKESSKRLDGNERYEGFGIELIDELSKMNEFNYTFELQLDGVYGSLDKKTGKWTGMMEKIMDGRADFAITDFTITSARQKAVDFTSPFMNLGITILYKKPTKQPPNLFSFISPFSLQVWGWLVGAYIGVSVLLYVLGRFAPEEWQNPYPCIENPETLDNQFTLPNSFWFTLGSVLTQGSEIAPIAVSTRMAGSMWWFFTLIMVSSYTANLAAFLTVESKFYAIKSVNDLASNPYDIIYGAKKGGATLGFFKESDNLLYQKMYQFMDEHPEYLTASNDEGVRKVQNENYAFLMESTSIEYIVERNCDIAQVGGLLDNKGYGIAMKKNSPYRQPMSESILQLQEEGKLTRMKEKWWKEKRGGGACADDDAGGGDAQPLVLANVGGVFIVLVSGSALAVICAFVEMMCDVWTIARREQVSFKEELIAELKFILSFSGDTKTVRHPKSSSSSSSSSKSDEKKDKENPQVVVEEQEPIPTRATTPKSEKSFHTKHGSHSRLRSNSMQIARSRKYS